MKLLLLALLIPIALNAQEEEPVLSKDYLDLIHNDSQHQKKGLRTDTTNSFKTTHFWLSGPYYGNPVKRIKVQHNRVIIEPLKRTYLAIGGNITSNVELKRANRLPAIQSQFVQGRSQNGSLVWRGPETGELFSYGPDIQTLEYDGGNYAFDNKGKLIAAGSGNGNKAHPYSNAVLRTATLFTQSVNMQWKLMRSGTQKLAGAVKFKSGLPRF
jgi:hypothetical protein